VDSTALSLSGSIRLPTLSFAKDSLLAIDSLDLLTRPSKLAVRRRFYEHLLLVDSALNGFRVTSCKKLRTLIPFRFGMLLEWLFGNPRWQVELTFDSGRKVTLDEVKHGIAADFERNAEIWQEMCDFEEFEAKVLAADSIDEVFGVFREFHVL
jgi:hypothetical protein